MNLPALCINRPVFASVLSLLVILIGLISYTRLTVREYPKIEEPIVTVSTSYPGASAEIIESQITQPLEDSLSGIEGIEYITSVSREERSQITRFKKIEPRKYIHAAITNSINPRNPPVKNFSLALTTNGILSGRCSIFLLCLIGGIEN